MNPEPKPQPYRISTSSTIPVVSNSGVGTRGTGNATYRLLPIGKMEYALFEVDA